MASRNENVPVIVYYNAYVVDCDEGVEFKGGNNILISMRRGMTFNFLFQQTSTENVYLPYPNSADVGDNQVPDNPNYRHFLDQQQQFDSHDDKLYVGQRFRQLEDLKHAVKMWHIKNHVTFKSKRCAKNTWVLCCPAEGCQWKLRASERKNLKVREIRMIEEPHTCVMPTISQDHNKMDSKLVGKNILAMVEENEQLTIPTFIAFVR
ncbi:hypothetical protein JHK86_054806 [Glycine max]|nr:hypothetical protein JHK86_054806 [Glycine max]